MTAQASALKRIRELVGSRGVVDDPQALETMLVDERGLYRGRAALAVRPASTEELAAVVRICHDAGIGMVPQGGNTGYCGGATPDATGTQVLINLGRLNGLREIDALGFTMTVGAGTVLAEVQAAAAAEGLCFPLRMGSEGSCQIGGNLATNAGGVAVLRYGTARDLALGIEAVLPDGTVLELLKPLRKDNSGYDLRDLLIGSEGTLGIITAAVLKLFPASPARVTALLALPELDCACRLLGRARRAAGDAITAFEYLSRTALELVLDRLGESEPLGSAAGHYVLVELRGAEGAALDDVLQRLFRSAAAAGEVGDGVVASSEAQARALWRLRERVPEAEKRAGGSVKHDVSVPIAAIPEFCGRAAAAVASVAAGARLSVYGHVGDGNLHFNVLAPAEAEPEKFLVEQGPRVTRAVHDTAAALGGSFSAEHGVGRLKRAELERYAPPAALAWMRAVKATVDPCGLMNPGKVVDPGACAGVLVR